ncbi:S-adenosyl-L-methionine-dependent tRNA 4-demethylwyosine synthase TYW1-like, partial [Lampetra planeri]
RAARDGAVVTERCARVAVRASLQGQRTVYRLTLVKAWNVEEVTAYANLVALGNPDFIEVKGVTYCGESSASSLTMANVPWHEEVVGFVQQLAAMLPDYELACEHEHSNCLLLAHKRVRAGTSGVWGPGWVVCVCVCTCLTDSTNPAARVRFPLTVNTSDDYLNRSWASARSTQPQMSTWCGG